MARPARLSRDQVVSAAFELIDDAGTDGLTMRALARRLGVDPMAIYRHVRDKDDLLGAMCDVAVSELGELDPAAPWEAQVRRLVLDLHAALLRRPALLPVLAVAPATPVSLVAAQRAIALLVAAGADEQAAANAFGAVFSYVIGAATVAIGDPPPAEDQTALLDGARGLLGDPDAPYLEVAASLMQDPDDLVRGLDVLIAGIRAAL